MELSESELSIVRVTVGPFHGAAAGRRTEPAKITDLGSQPDPHYSLITLSLLNSPGHYQEFGRYKH